jgi:hypothetical protein
LIVVLAEVEVVLADAAPFFLIDYAEIGSLYSVAIR